MKNILFVASESVPFIKTGGLADVIGSLPKMFDKNEYDVRVVIPNYTCIPGEYRDKFKYITHFYMDLGWFKEPYHVGIMQMVYEGVTYYFIDNEHYFGGYTPYSNSREDIEKFSFFDKAVLCILPAINFKPDIIHCHDWQTGLIPVYLKTYFNDNPFFSEIKTIMTIHNLKFQGKWDIETIRGITGLSNDIFTSDKLEFYKGANMLKGGLVYADYITTVSDTYSLEIQYPYYGEGLDGLLRARNHQLRGIVNGIDYAEYNPETDNKIFARYNDTNVRAKKAENKKRLQERLGLKVDESKFMVGIISRLTDQKGLDLVNWVMNSICDDNTQFVVLGTGDYFYEQTFRHYENDMNDRVSANIFYSDELAHKLYAGADALLMPSRFEPCGLTQLIALKYGTIPIVRETGGLKDTVEPYDEYKKTGTGFSFTNYDANEMLSLINYAKYTYFNNRNDWDDMVVRAMDKNYSWDNSAKKYEEIYRGIIS